MPTSGISFTFNAMREKGGSSYHIVFPMRGKEREVVAKVIDLEISIRSIVFLEAQTSLF